MSPRFGQLAATEVWAAAARTLTALTGQPRTDLVGSDAALWAAAARTLTDISAEEIFDLPKLSGGYDYAVPTSSATGDAFGSWVQLSANIGTGKRLIAIYITPNEDLVAPFLLEIGEGGSGSEVAVAEAGGYQGRQSAVGYLTGMVYYVWRSLTDGARISCRIKDDDAAARGYVVQIMVA